MNVATKLVVKQFVIILWHFRCWYTHTHIYINPYKYCHQLEHCCCRCCCFFGIYCNNSAVMLILLHVHSVSHCVTHMRKQIKFVYKPSYGVSFTRTITTTSSTPHDDYGDRYLWCIYKCIPRHTRAHTRADFLVGPMELCHTYILRLLKFIKKVPFDKYNLSLRDALFFRRFFRCSCK